MSPVQCQSIIWMNIGLSLTGQVRTYLSEIFIKIENFSFKEFENLVYKTATLSEPQHDTFDLTWHLQYIQRNMHTVFALLCFVVVIHWLIFPYPSGLLHWYCGNLTIAPVPAKQPWWIWINTSCEFIMNDCITTTKQSTTKPCAYFLGYTVHDVWHILVWQWGLWNQFIWLGKFLQ